MKAEVRKRLNKIFATLLFTIILALIVGACSDPIILKDIRTKKEGHLMYGASPGRNFYYPFRIGDSLKEKWRSDIHGSFSNSSVIGYYDYIFTPDLSGRIYCFNINTGDELGMMKEENGEIAVAPVMDNFVIIYVRNNFKADYATIYFYNTFLNNYKKKLNIYGAVNNELIITDESIYVLTDKGTLHKIGLDGDKEWEQKTGTSVNCNPAYKNGKILFGNKKGELISISKYGKINYKKEFNAPINGGITIKENNAYFGTSNGDLICTDVNSGDLIWKKSIGSKIVVHPVIDDKNVYISNLSGKIVALNKDTGKFLWKTQTKGMFNSTPICFDDYLLQPDLDEKVHFVDKTNGEIVKTFNYENRVKMTPVYFKELLFIGIDDGEVIAYESIKNGQ